MTKALLAGLLVAQGAQVQGFSPRELFDSSGSWIPQVSLPKLFQQGPEAEQRAIARRERWIRNSGGPAMQAKLESGERITMSDALDDKIHQFEEAGHKAKERLHERLQRKLTNKA